MNEDRRTEPKIVPQLTLSQFDAMFPDEQSCWAYLRLRRWPEGVRCPRCNNDHVYESKARPWHWQCLNCGPRPRSPYRFSLKTGTVFEETKKPLRTWFKVLHLMLTSKKGISALQIHRMIGSAKYQTAWYMCMRLRASLNNPDFRKLMGIVEIDESMFGGKERNKHVGKRDPRNRGERGKTTVIGAISRKGNVVCQVIEHADRAHMMSFVRRVVDKDKVEVVMTDEAKGYDTIGENMRHEVIQHREEIYVRGIVHTQNIESFWALLKRGVIGTYHHVSKKYLPLYLNEFQWRFNNRKNPDIFGEAIAGC